MPLSIETEVTEAGRSPWRQELCIKLGVLVDSCNPALIGEKQEDCTFEARGYLMRAEERRVE